MFIRANAIEKDGFYFSFPELENDVQGVPSEGSS